MSSVQTVMELFDLLMTPDGGGSERLMGKYFHNLFVPKNESEGTRENGLLWNNAGASKGLYLSVNSKILNTRPLTSTATVIHFR